MTQGRPWHLCVLGLHAQTTPHAFPQACTPLPCPREGQQAQCQPGTWNLSLPLPSACPCSGSGQTWSPGLLDGRPGRGRDLGEYILALGPRPSQPIQPSPAASGSLCPPGLCPPRKPWALPAASLLPRDPQPMPGLLPGLTGQERTPILPVPQVSWEMAESPPQPQLPAWPWSQPRVCPCPLPGLASSHSPASWGPFFLVIYSRSSRPLTPSRALAVAMDREPGPT